MPLSSRLDHPTAWLGDNDPIPEQSAKCAVKDEGVFVLAVVAVQRSGESSRSQRMMDYGKSSTALFPVNFPTDSEPAEIESFAVFGGNYSRHIAHIAALGLAFTAMATTEWQDAVSSFLMKARLERAWQRETELTWTNWRRVLADGRAGTKASVQLP